MQPPFCLKELYSCTSRQISPEYIPGDHGRRLRLCVRRGHEEDTQHDRQGKVLREGAQQGARALDSTIAKLRIWEKSPLMPHMGTAFFVEGGEKFFSCVHGSKMAIGEVMLLAATARVKGGGENFTHQRK